MKIKPLSFLFISIFFIGCDHAGNLDQQKSITLSSFQTKLNDSKTSYSESYFWTARLIGAGAKAASEGEFEFSWDLFKSTDLRDRVKQSKDAYLLINDAEKDFNQIYINNKNIPESIKTNFYELKAIIENNALFIGMLADGQGSTNAAMKWKNQSEKAENIFKSLDLEIERLKK